MLENSLTLFTIAGVITAYVGLLKPKSTWNFLWGILSGCLISAAFLTKGFMGLFPLALPFIALLCFSNIKKSSVLYTFLGMLFPLCLTAGYVYFNTDAHTFFSRYFNEQLLPSLTGLRERKDTRLYLVGKFFYEAIIPIVICFVLQLSVKRNLKLNFSRKTLFYLLIALSASLPLMISPKQSIWYLFPGFPFYAMALASAFAPAGIEAEKALSNSNRKQIFIMVLALLITLGSCAAMVADRNNIRKEKRFHEDFTAQKLIIPEWETITVCPPSLIRNWSLNANMARIFKAKLTEETGHSYYLTEKDSLCPIPKGCIKIHPQDPKNYVLYKCEPKNQ
jgi:4-amino-4-deoxy-L-arabinose transferase-like glycosyltransferase